MKVQILKGKTFSKFNIPGYRHRVGRQQLAIGDVVDFPDWYAKSIIEAGLAEAYVGPKAQTATQLINATNAAFRLATELDVDLLTVEGSGANGRITAGDVRMAAQ